MRPTIPLFLASGLVISGMGQSMHREFATETVWHDNVTNAEQPQDVLSALQSRAEFSIGQQLVLAGGHRLQGLARLRTELWPRFEGLNFVAPGLVGAWEFKSGLGPHRPVLGVESEVEWVLAQEPARGGWGAAGRLTLRQRVGTAWILLLGHEARRFDARGRAFNRTAQESLGRVQWGVGESWSLALEVRNRWGTVVSYSRPPRPDLVAIGKPISLVDTFEQASPWIAYYFQARTLSGAVELQRSLGRAAIALRHEYRNTLHAGPGYQNRLTTLRFDTPF